MNEVFDIKRLWKLMQYEAVNYIPNFFKSLLIFSSVIAATWIFSLTVDFNVLPDGRDKLVAGLFMLAIILSPFIVYKDMNNRKKGYIYAMIPASTLEKLLSMIALCVVVVPVLTYAVLTTTDLLLWLFTKIGMGSFHEMVFYNPFTETFATEVYEDGFLTYSLPLFDTVIYLMYTISYTIMFNTIFRKNKVLRTILFNISLVFALVILTSVTISITSPEFWEGIGRSLQSYFKDWTAEEGIRLVLNITRLLSIAFTALFLTIAYFRIKRVNY